MISKEQYEQALLIVNKYRKQKKETEEQTIKKIRNGTIKIANRYLTYSRYYRCQCGAGMAFITEHKERLWFCSDYIKGRNRREEHSERLIHGVKVHGCMNLKESETNSTRKFDHSKDSYYQFF